MTIESWEKPDAPRAGFEHRCGNEKQIGRADLPHARRRDCAT
jgi:hypothetical protein